MRARPASSVVLERPPQRIRAGLRRVCLVGHEPASVRALGRLLGKEFYLLIAEDVDDFLSVLHSGARLDALVLGFRLSGVDEARVTQALEAEKPDLPVFMFTPAEETSAERDRIAGLGVRGFFKKPKDIWKLAEVLHLELGPTREDQREPPTGMRGNTLVAGAINYIEENLITIRGSTDVSGHLGVTREHLSRQFTKYTGHTLWDFITMCRVDRAKELLRQRSLLVKQIFREVGFNCESSFFRAFVRHTGLTPEGYRRELAN
ncbi:MAG: DNA-binding response regulator [Candidatus Eisenbacteria bacterium]